ncbi:hypothetical protein [Dyadobacter aurulentus]|uniref:hypothetical protein n=1 Tax=Dyadobacter sp. UC 10 TaxID=2605428 RepID=UPI0011F1C786|nr:hypothetical protein [Dyadobacter sp. UC 10]KAA0988659.1 hypothetical protein FXO21_00005 [Dyadobacter sp. UC 10]
MKTLIASVLVAFALTSSPSFAANTFDHSATSVENPEIRFWVVTGENGKIDVNVIKSEIRNLSITLTDKSGHTLATSDISADSAATRTRFDLNALPDGEYQVILIDGKTKQVKTIELNTQETETVRKVSVA